MPRRERHGHYKKAGTKNKKQAAARDKRAADAAAADQQAAAEAEEAVEAAEDSSEDEQPSCERDGAQEDRSRQVMVWLFVKMGSPPEAEWSGPGGVLSEIRKVLGRRHDCNLNRIKAVLRRHINGEPLVKPRSGRPPLLTHGEALIGADCLRSGKGRDQAACILSARRQQQGKSKCCELHGHRMKPRAGRRRKRTQPYEYPSCPTAEALTEKRYAELDPDGAAAIAAAKIAAAAPKKRGRGKENATGSNEDAAGNAAPRTRRRD